MISKLEIQELIDDVEVHYQRCWDTLSGLRSANPTGLDAQSLLRVQPTLAQCLFDLDEAYRALHQEKPRLIRKQTSLSREWLNHRLKLIRSYQEAVKDCVAIGKALGDAFAWVFYSRDREYLREHMKHQNNFHVPPGIGGQGELELIKGVPLIEDCLIIYHQLTNFLRIGDVSIYDLRQGRLRALGEIKTTQVAPGKLEISLSTLGPAQHAHLHSRHQLKKMDSIGDLVSPNLTPYMSSKLRRQLGEIAQSFEVSEPDDIFEMHGDFHFDDLERLFKGIDASPVVYQKVGDGLLLIGLKDRRKRLSARIMTRSTEKLVARLGDTPKHALKILDTESEYNSLFVYSWHNPDPKYQPQIGMTPFFWWPLDPDLIEKVIFKKMLIVALYNPCYFISKLQELGFQVEYTEDANRLVVKKTDGDRTAQIENFAYFVNLIALQLFSEEAVARMVQDFMSTIEAKLESHDLPEMVRAELIIQQHI